MIWALLSLAGSLGAEQMTPVCAGCHPQQTARYMDSAMGHSVGAPRRDTPEGKVTQGEADFSGSVLWSAPGMVHRLKEDGLTADYRVSYQIGAGKVGHSYAAQIGNVLLESPLSYYRQFGWDVSPGYRGRQVLDFDRVLGERCLTCHADRSNVSAGSLSSRLIPIGCERCHGASAEHVRHPSAANIIQPAKLPIRARDSICEQCHLEGVARVFNPGKHAGDFHPGDEFEATSTIYVAVENGSAAKAVSQVEQLAASRCVIASAGKLWCGTCHNPHGEAKNRASEIKSICQQCHATLSAASHRPAPADCVACHMPRRTPTDVAHAAATDHRILKNPQAAAGSTAVALPELRAWHEPAVGLRDRNRALADREAAASPIYASLGEEGERLLSSLSETSAKNDAPVAAALGNVKLAVRAYGEAVERFRAAATLDPQNASYAMFLGIALSKKGETDAAIEALRSAIRLDPSLQRAYLELSALFANAGRQSEARKTLDAYLQWNPQSILMRLSEDAVAARGRPR